MTRFVSSRFQLPLLACAVALVGCTFEPPGSVLNSTVGPRPDAGGGGDTPDAGGGGEATETLTFTFTSSPTGAAGGTDYQPANVVATWIEDSAGTPVATINRQSAARTSSLEGWILKVGAGNTDAVTGASRINHATPVVVTWPIPAELANGIYTIRVETSDHNPGDITPAENNQGTYTFDKNGTSSNVAGADGNGYTGVIIDYAVTTP